MVWYRDIASTTEARTRCGYTRLVISSVPQGNPLDVRPRIGLSKLTQQTTLPVIASPRLRLHSVCLVTTRFISNLRDQKIVRELKGAYPGMPCRSPLVLANLSCATDLLAHFPAPSCFYALQLGKHRCAHRILPASYHAASQCENHTYCRCGQKRKLQRFERQNCHAVLQRYEDTPINHHSLQATCSK